MTRTIIWRYIRAVFYVWLGMILVVGGFILAIFPILPGLPIVVLGIFMIAKHTGILGAEKEKDLRERLRHFKEWIVRRIKDIKL